jgi:TIR domain
MADIFLSYVPQDLKKAEALAEALQSEGWSVWWDRQIPAGRIFDEVIQDEITSARCIIVLWSQKSVHSSWVKAEALDGYKEVP